jgi:hypothetical protein
MDRTLLLNYLDNRRRPIKDDPKAAERHRAICTQEPELYLDLLADRSADIFQRREVLRNLMEHAATDRFSRAAILERLAPQPLGEALASLEVLRLGRCNGRAARSLGLSFLLGHERFAELVATKRTRLFKLPKHLLGERTWSSVVRVLRTGAVNSARRSKKPRLLAAALLERLRSRFSAEPKTVADAEAFLHRTVCGRWIAAIGLRASGIPACPALCRA